ncbi:Toll-interacting protein [Strongyloides ratti]|uniref:Toll-interacting protein n=1 Tax=Strongyloides ratti TaxID=34506 RepID=A0A090KQ60_STRRB|nr:Toll-interacting protein [Strongyloides ratti]CEF59519.1 Toll-interacting protein [Strongyloides ratti]
MSSDDVLPSSSGILFQEQRLINIPELKKRVLLLKDMPEHFLRFSESINLSREHISSISNIDPEEAFYRFVPPNTRGRLIISVMEAKLTKSYSLVRMDPYCKIRVGNVTFQTPTHTNGGKNPKWDKTINAYLPNGVDSFFLQIYDEKQFTKDECIAWVHVILKEGIFHGEKFDEWYPLSGAQGDGREGIINLQISFLPLDNYRRSISLSELQISTPNNTYYDEAEIDELSSMFPNIEREVIKSVLEEKRGNKDDTVTILLELNDS